MEILHANQLMVLFFFLPHPKAKGENILEVASWCPLDNNIRPVKVYLVKTHNRHWRIFNGRMKLGFI